MIQFLHPITGASADWKSIIITAERAEVSCKSANQFSKSSCPKCIITVEVDRPLTKQELDFFTNEFDEWLFNRLQLFDDVPFGDLTIKCPMQTTTDGTGSSRNLE